MTTDKDIRKRLWRGLRLGVKKVENYVPKIDTAHARPDEEADEVTKADGDVEVVHVPLYDRGNMREPLPAHVRKRAPQPQDEAAEIRQRFATATEATKAEIERLAAQPAQAPRRPKARESDLSTAIREVFGLDARKAERRPRTFSENLAASHAEAEILKIEGIQRLLASAPTAPPAQSHAQKVEVKKTPAERLQNRIRVSVTEREKS